MKILAVFLLTCTTLPPNWCAPVNDVPGVLDYGVHNHTDPHRDGKLFVNNKISIGDISVSGSVNGDDVSIGSKLGINVGKSMDSGSPNMEKHTERVTTTTLRPVGLFAPRVSGSYWIESSGGAALHHPSKMGIYTHNGDIVEGHPVYVHDGAYLYVDSYGYWTVGPDTRRTEGWLYHEDKEPTPKDPPLVGWKYGYDGWHDDTTLSVTHLGGDIDELLLYEHTDEAGRSLRIIGPTNNLKLHNFNDLVSSVHAIKGDWELYVNSDYEGSRMSVTEGQKIDTRFNDVYSSARPTCQYYDDPSAAKLKVYEQVSSQGNMKEFFREVEKFEDFIIRSVHVIKGDWEIYSYATYGLANFQRESFAGFRVVVKEGEQKNVEILNKLGVKTSLRPICETYSPKCTPIRIEITGNGKERLDGIQILGPSSQFSCSGPDKSTLQLSDATEVTESTSLEFSSSKEINWSIGASVSLSVSANVEAGVPGIGTVGTEVEVSASASVSSGESYTVSHSETKTVTTASEQVAAYSVTFDTPGGAIAFGEVKKYVIDNSDVPVNVHVNCSGKPKIIKSTMTLKSTLYKSAHFSHFSKSATEENCNKDGYYTVVNKCIQNINVKFLNNPGEKEELKKKFEYCF